MKKYLIGACAGSIVTASLLLGATAFANSSITAALQDIHYLFDGQQKYLSTGYTSIMYKDHVYVPARFVAEQLGAQVGWDNNTQTVIIKTGSTLAGNPEALPVSFTQDMVTVTVNSISQQSDRTIFNVTVTNKSAAVAHLASSLAQMVYNGQQSNYPNLSDPDGSPTDMEWVNDVQPGASMSGTITMNALPSNATSVKLYAPIQFENGNLDQFTAIDNIQISNQ